MTVIDQLKPFYAEILNLMPDEFDSHQFILKLAQKRQPEYVRALYAYVDVADKAVFRTLHGQIAQSLHDYAVFVRNHESPDIFGNSQPNAIWHKRT